VTLDAGLSDQWRAIVTDPQTSGGLLIALAPEAAGETCAFLRAEGFGKAGIVGAAEAGADTVRIA